MSILPENSPYAARNVPSSGAGRLLWGRNRGHLAPGMPLLVTPLGASTVMAIAPQQASRIYRFRTEADVTSNGAVTVKRNDTTTNAPVRQIYRIPDAFFTGATVNGVAPPTALPSGAVTNPQDYGNCIALITDSAISPIFTDSNGVPQTPVQYLRIAGINVSGTTLPTDPAAGQWAVIDDNVIVGGTDGSFKSVIFGSQLPLGKVITLIVPVTTDITDVVTGATSPTALTTDTLYNVTMGAALVVGAAGINVSVTARG